MNVKKLDERIDRRIDARLKDNLRKEILLILVSVALTALFTFWITYHFQEKYADITSAYQINNNSITFTLHNNAGIAASEIKFITYINGEEKTLKVIRDKILSDEKDLTISIPIIYVNKTSDIRRLPKVANWDLGGFSIPTRIDLQETYLFYRIECDKCKSSSPDWRIIKPEDLKYTLIVKNEGGILISTALLHKPIWADIKSY